MRDLPKIDLSRFRIEGVTAELKHAAAAPTVELTIVGEVFDTKTGRRTTAVSKRSLNVDMKRAPKLLSSIVKEALMGWLDHELNECLFIDGKRLCDPHPELGRPRADWEPEPSCDCPQTKAEIDLWKGDTIRVCDRAFTQLAALYKIPNTEALRIRGGFQVYRAPRFNASFTSVIEPSSVCTARITAEREHA